VKGKIKTAYTTQYNRKNTTVKDLATFAQDTYEKQWPSVKGENKKLSLNHEAFVGLFLNSPSTTLSHIGRFSSSYGINPAQQYEFCQFSQMKQERKRRGRKYNTFPLHTQSLHIIENNDPRN